MHTGRHASTTLHLILQQHDVTYVYDDDDDDDVTYVYDDVTYVYRKTREHHASPHPPAAA